MGLQFDCPTVDKKVQGKRYTLRLDFNAVVLAEKLSGVKLLDPDAWLGMSTEVVTSIFFAAAVQTDETLKLSEFRRMRFDGDTKSLIIDAVREAWRAVNETSPDVPRPTGELEAVAQADGAP